MGVRTLLKNFPSPGRKRRGEITYMRWKLRKMKGFMRTERSRAGSGRKLKKMAVTTRKYE